MSRSFRLVFAALACAFAIDARADVCADASTATANDTASRIARIACAEHDLWYAPFIDENGRLANMRVSEAESSRLRDGATPAWRRVAMYWQGSGVAWPPQGLAGDADCNSMNGVSAGAALCRAFLIDTPWSAVFVSYVMTRAGVPGFQPSARHVDYVRDAFRQGATGPYRLADPDAEAPATGDMVCFARVSQVYGVQGFRDWLGRSSGALAMHCDIVVSTANNRARLVGGNVLQGVTMRVLPLNRLGKFWALPHRSGGEAECDPGLPSACNFNRQDWVALLKLNPSANVPLSSPLTPTPTRCCTVCMLPMPPDMRRCPVPSPSPTTTPAP
ncbi:DUF2272 domain-containing protein [Lysobacter claricitrinus]|uniref:DUF2272 domain-containing protein n=1 Tax=Lysobacter claricitrinus TaxID=3367728 RepID=UPI0037DAF2A7